MTWLFPGRALPVRVAATFVFLLSCATERTVDDTRADDAASHMCDAWVTCKCATPWEDGEACLVAATDIWQARIREADHRRLWFDADCFDRLLLALDDRGCELPNAGQPRLCETFCAPFHGERELGESCDRHDELVSDCAAGLLCDGQRCVEPCSVLSGRGEGQMCFDPERYRIFDDCADGLYCSYQSGKCQRSIGEGAWCGEGQGCDDGLYCSYDGYCERASAPGGDCSEGHCAEGAWCDWQTQTCRAEAGEGEPCPSGFCVAGFVCDSQTTTCRAPAGEGAACVSGTCAAGLYCDYQINLCTPPPALGESCPYGICAAELWCDTTETPEGRCTDKRAVWEPCNAFEQCQSNYCPRGACEVRPGDGEACELGVCATGLVCAAGTCRPGAARGPAACIYSGW